MARYVFNGAKCICQSCPTAIGNLKENNKVSGEFHNGIISVNCNPDMKGMCNMPTNPAVAAAGGVPQKCEPVWITPWKNIECVKNIKILGQEPLLESALKICAYGGVLEIFSPSCTKINHNMAPLLNFSKIHRIVETQRVKNKLSDDVVKEIKQSMGNIFSKQQGVITSGIDDVDDIVVKNRRGPAYKFSEDEDYQKAAKSAVKVADMSHEEKKAVLKENIYRASGHICSANCPEGMSCDFAVDVPKNSVVIRKESNGTTLKNNMINNDSFSDYDRETFAIIDKINKNNPYKDKVEFTVEYHHIIPGKQCFEKRKELVELANFYGYDINTPENGIPLPSFKPKNGVSLSKDEFQEIRMYLIDKTGRQLHKGGHSYESRLSKNRVVAEDYEKQVYKILQKTEKFLCRSKLSYSCRKNQSAEDFEKEAKEFHDMMNNISKHLRDSIMKFPDSKVFVSYASAEYAYNKKQNGGI